MARLQFKPGAVPTFANKEAKRLVQSTLRAVNAQARRNAPGGPYSTGRLKGNIFWGLTREDRGGVSGVSGSPLVYAYSVHEGQPARTIVPVRKPRLVFFWRRTGMVEKFLSVSHPGTKGQPYLTDALIKVAPARGFRVVIF